jgi:hypothetical protein
MLVTDLSYRNFNILNQDDKPKVVFTKENWFKLKKNQGTSVEYKTLPYCDFIDELELQVKRDLSINLKNCFKSKYHVGSLDIVVTNKKYDEFKTNDSEYLPVLTYHVTTSNKNVNSIVSHGYLLPGTRHPIGNQKIKMAHGNFYGTGIYSFMSSVSAAFMSLFESDDNEDLQVIVNLVNLRKPRIFTEEDFQPKSKSSNKRKDPLPNINDNILPYYLTPDMDGNYVLSITDVSKVATALIFDNNMIVVGSPVDIIPLCVVTLTPVINPLKIHSFKLTDKDEKPQIHKKSLSLLHSIDASIPAIRICDDLYMLTQSLNVKIEPSLIYYFMIPDLFLNVSNKNTLETYISTKKNCQIYCLGNKGFSVKNNLENVKYRSNIINLKTMKINIRDALEHLIKQVMNTNNETNVVYLFANDFNIDFIDTLVNKYSKIIKFKRLVIKVITLDNNHNNTQPAIQLKYYLQTETIFDNAIYALCDHDLNEILQFIDDENLEINTQLDTFDCCKIYFGSGFITNIHKLPEHGTRAKHPVYKGAAQKYFKVNGDIRRITYVEHVNLENLSAQIHGYNQLLNLLCNFRNFILVNPKLIGQYSTILNRIVTCTTNNLKAIVEFVTKLEHSQNKVNSIKSIKQINYKLDKIISDITTFTKSKLSGKWYNSLLNMKFGKRVIKRTAKYRQCLDSTPEELCASTLQGIAINCTISAASNIEPWLIKITHVSNNNLTLGIVFTNAELSKETKDNDGNTITDILLPVSHPLSDIMKMYYSYIFTRNIYTFLPSQPIALLTNTWIHLLETFFKSTNQRILNEELKEDQVVKYRESFEKVWNLYKIVKDSYATVNITTELEYFNKFITTGVNELATMNQLVGLALQLDDNILTDDNFIKCFMECITKSTKSYVKQSDQSVANLLSDLLGLYMETDIENYVLNVQRAIKISGKFYRTINSSCSPFSFVAMWEFLLLINKGFDKESIFDKFLTKEISMKACLRYFNKYNNNVNNQGLIVQIALYIHSLKCCQNKQYKIKNYIDGGFDCNKVIEDTKTECIQNIITKRSLLHCQNTRRAKRLEIILNKGQDYAIYHKIPNLFTNKQIAELNSNRPKNDQLELMPSGLLKHACCYPDCPKYLHNFQTQKDRETGKRYGLMHHLRYDMYLNNYFPGYHAIGKQLVLQSFSFKDFLNTMTSHYKKTRYSYAMNQNNEIFVETCRDIYKFYKPGCE